MLRCAELAFPATLALWEGTPWRRVTCSRGTGFLCGSGVNCSAAAKKEVAASVKSDGVAADELAQWNAHYGDGGICGSSRTHLSYYL